MQWHRHVCFALLDCEKRLARMEQPHGEPDELYRTPNIETLTVVMLYPMLDCRDIHLPTSAHRRHVNRHPWSSDHSSDITTSLFALATPYPRAPRRAPARGTSMGRRSVPGGVPARSENASPAQRGSLPGNEGCEQLRSVICTREARGSFSC